MSTKNFFIVQAILALGFGLPFLFYPPFLVDTFTGESQNLSTLADNLSRLYGSVLVGLGVGFYYMRNTGSSLARRGLFIAILIAQSLYALLHIRALYNGFENTLGWFNLLLAISIAVWSGLLLSKEKDQVLS